jgi:hypothetical protein
MGRMRRKAMQRMVLGPTVRPPTGRVKGAGLRVKKVAGSTTTRYIYSGIKVTAEYVNGTINKGIHLLQLLKADLSLSQKHLFLERSVATHAVIGGKNRHD